MQQFVADRFRQQLGWQTVRNSWTLLSGILETAVEYGYLTMNPARRVKFPQQEAREAPAIIAGDAFARLLNELSEPYRAERTPRPIRSVPRNPLVRIGGAARI